MSEEIVKAVRGRVEQLLRDEAAREGSPIDEVWRGGRSTELEFTACGRSVFVTLSLRLRDLPPGAVIVRAGEGGGE